MQQISMLARSGRNTDLFCQFIARRTEKNQNFIVVTVGGPGTGKSYSTCRLSLNISILRGVPFWVHHVGFTPYEFMKIHQMGYPPGTHIMMDEGGTGLNAKRFMSNVNIAMGNLFQTSRRYRYVYWLNLPNVRDLDSTVRDLVHCIIQAGPVIESQGICIMRPRLLNINRGNLVGARTKDVWKIKARVKIPQHPLYDIDRMNVPAPPQEFIDAYEDKKLAFTDRLNKRVMRVVHDPTMDDDTVIKPITDAQAKVAYLAKEEGLANYQIAEVLGCTAMNITLHMKAIKAAGLSVIAPRQRGLKEWSDTKRAVLKHKVKGVTAEFFVNDKELIVGN